jgi:hypothetical protein
MGAGAEAERGSGKVKKKTILFHHEFLALLRLIQPEKAMAVINALCDIDLGLDPDINDSGVKALVETKRESLMKDRKRYDEAVERIENARKNRGKKDDSPDENIIDINDFGSDFREKNNEINEKKEEVNTEVSNEVNTDFNAPSPSPSPLYTPPNDDEESAGPRGKDFLSSSGCAPQISPREHPRPKQTSPPLAMACGNASAVWEAIRKAWNAHNCPFTCDKLYLNLSPALRERVSGSMATYTAEQMIRAIDRYFEEREKNPSGYEYKSFYLFVEKGMEFYVEAA